MDCKFCYLDFNEPRTDYAAWEQIVDRLAALGIQSVTFAGGDPFMYQDFQRLLHHAKNKARFSFIQIDTNGLCIDPSHYRVICENCDLLGLPLDGSNSELNAQMRDNDEHYDKVIILLHEFSKLGVKIKVNTVVSRINLYDLPDLEKLLTKFNIKIWSLYEFWPQGPSVKHASKYSIPKAEFIKIANQIFESASFTKVEIGTVESRRPSYFFVSHAGRAYTINRNNDQEILALGSIFDEDILQKWNDQADRFHGESRLTNRMQLLNYPS